MAAAGRVKLGSSDLEVSGTAWKAQRLTTASRPCNSIIVCAECCLGSMTWGRQNTEQEAHTQLGYAFDLGVNFLDTAEM